MKMEEDEAEEDGMKEVMWESQQDEEARVLRDENAQLKAALELSQRTAAEENARRELQAAEENARRELRAAEERAMAEFRGHQAAVRKGGKGGDSGKGKRR